MNFVFRSGLLRLRPAPNGAGLRLAMTLVVLLIVLTSCSRNQKFVEINNHKINIEVADTDEKRTKGLSGRKTLCDNCGMLFVFEEPGNYSFWMKDMNFLLDFIYIKGDTIVDLKQNISPNTYPQIINSLELFDKVLETNQGIIDKYNIKIGEVVK